MRLPNLFLALAGCLFATALSAGEVYKWVDKQGRVHLSDQPQPGWTKVPTQATAKPAAAPAGEDAEQLAKRAAECEAKKQQLDSYRIATRIVEKDALGRDREYTAEERAKLMEQTEKQVSELCSPPPG